MKYIDKQYIIVDTIHRHETSGDRHARIPFEATQFQRRDHR